MLLIEDAGSGHDTVRVNFFKIFEQIFSHPSRFKVIVKGRRVGFTHHCAIYVIERCLEAENTNRSISILWGDTTHENIVRYVERYFLPYLKHLSQETMKWRWYKNEKKLFIGDSVADFRSADRPENWEGFGYDLIILNEAGIILKNRYLWENAVRPMLLDNPRSQAIIGGVPKGKNKFYELYSDAKSGRLGKDWTAFKLTTYDNPLIDTAEIEKLKQELGDERIVKQEIYGEFVESEDAYLFNYEDLIRATKTEHQPEGTEFWGLDVGITNDEAVLIKRRGRCVDEIKSWKNIGDTMLLAKAVAEEFRGSSIKPYTVYVDTVGIGWGVADRLAEFGLPVRHVNFAESSKSGLIQFKNLRAEAYFRLKDEIAKGGLKIPHDVLLISELSIIRYRTDKKGAVVIAPKAELKSELGHSPDRADALALTFVDPIITEGIAYFSNPSYTL